MALTIAEKTFIKALERVQAAIEYRNRGISVIPLHSSIEPLSAPPDKRGKSPIVAWREYQSRLPTDDELESWFPPGSDRNIGIVTGAVSGLTVVDFDSREAITLAEAKGFPRSPLVKTARGYHAYCSYTPGQRNFQKRDDLPGIDLRAEGGYAVAPPSIHLTGIMYQWVDGRSLDDLPLPVVPDWIFTRDESERKPVADVFQGASEGSRNESLVRVCGSLFGKGYSLDDALQFALTWNSKNSPPLPESEVQRTCQSIWEIHKRNHPDGWVTPLHTCKTPPEGESESLKPGSRIHVVSVLDFMSIEFPPRENLLAPWLPVQGLAMVYAPRGIGKTHFSLGVAYAVSSAGEFLGWQATRPASVLFIDGEMPAVTLQKRIALINLSSQKDPAAPFKIITPDLQDPLTGMIDLSRPADQRELEPALDGVDLIVIDNLSTLCRSGKESEGEGWLPVQSWVLRQRAAGRSVLLVHHSGKNGEQRGTSRREDVLDTVIALRRPADYTPDKGANFEVHFEKARGIFGDETKPFEAQLNINPSGLQEWTIKNLDKSTAEKVAALLDEGLTQMEIAEMLKLTKGAVSKARKRAGDLGLLKAVS